MLVVCSYYVQLIYISGCVNLIVPADILIVPPGFSEGMMFDKHFSSRSPWVTIENVESQTVDTLGVLFSGGVWEEMFKDQEAHVHHRDEVK